MDDSVLVPVIAGTAAPQSKTCRLCWVAKSITEFGADRSGMLGVRAQCRDCRTAFRRKPEQVAKTRAYDAVRVAKPEVKASRAAYMAHYRATPDGAARSRVAAMKYFATAGAKTRKAEYENSDGGRARRAQRQAKESARERRRAYDASPKGRARLHVAVQLRRARRAGAGGTFTQKDVTAMLISQSGLCNYCGCQLPASFHVDHMVPLSRGGTSWPSNLCCSCPKCNRRKWSMTADEFTCSSHRKVA